MDNYDSILKEKKVYADPEPLIKKTKYTKYFVIDFFVILIVLVVSYFIYYHNVLSPKNVIINDVSYFEDIGKQILLPLQIDFDSDYAFSGNFNIDNLAYKYDLVRNDKNMLLKLSLNDKSAFYYLDNNIMYANFSDFLKDSYIESNNKYNWINMYREYIENYDSVLNSDIQLFKKFYVEKTTPIVEVTCILKKDDINRLFGTTLVLDDFEVTLTFKNNAITNEIVDGKLVINNKTKDNRNVITYQKNTFIFTDNDGESVKYFLEITKSKFSLKVYKSDELYSMFFGNKTSDGYSYNYQVMDKIYKLALNIKNGENTEYEFTSSIGEDSQHIMEKKFSISRLDNKSLDNKVNISNKKNYSSLSDEEKKIYQEHYDKFILPIRKFIDEYKDGVN